MYVIETWLEPLAPPAAVACLQLFSAVGGWDQCRLRPSSLRPPGSQRLSATMNLTSGSTVQQPSSCTLLDCVLLCVDHFCSDCLCICCEPVQQLHSQGPLCTGTCRAAPATTDQTASPSHSNSMQYRANWLHCCAVAELAALHAQWPPYSL